MVSPDQSHHSPTMAKPQFRSKSFSFLTDTFLFVSGALSAFLLVWGCYSFLNPNPANTRINFSPFGENKPKPNQDKRPEPIITSPTLQKLDEDSPAPSFYDDRNLSYSIETPMENWDEKRNHWLNQHPTFAPGLQDRILILTGSKPDACENPIGDHLLLRFFKNKVDYARIHGYDIFYNNALLHPKMCSYWAKLPLVRSAMIAHPEAEWIWWVDSDAAFTDMELKLPLNKYKNHNLVVHGWANMVYDEKSWVSLNAGVFLIRNCQWSMDFMDVWANMGPQTPDYAMWGKIQRETFKDKLFPEADDQSGLVYLLLKEKEKWGNKIYLEGEYYFQGYWEDIVGTYANITEKYLDIERAVRKLRRRHAEKVSEFYGALREEYLKDAGNGKGSWRKPFITHFTGCQPCSGVHNPRYTAERCLNGMETALNFADNQVLRSFGYTRSDLLDPGSIELLPFDSSVA